MDAPIENLPDADTHEPTSDLRSERLRVRKAIKAHGWRYVNASTVEIKCERRFTIGPREIVIRGYVAVDTPHELTEEAGQLAAGLVADPSMSEFERNMLRTVDRILTDPDDVATTMAFTRGSFFSAIEDARRGLIAAWQALENKRIDERVEAELGIRFYLGSFRAEERTFSYFVGPTNSGKTYAAIEALREAKRGVYLAPLRLLALEVSERLLELGVPTSLVTGEERVLHPEATHVSSTIEMVDLGSDYDVAVIDEAQMLEDSQRGWAWTLAVAGVRAKHVIMCGSVEGQHAVERLMLRLNAKLNVRRFERKNRLHPVAAITLGGLRPGDAVVDFSRRAVVERQGEIAHLGFSSAAIYGSLSPAVRRREAERFRNGEAEILVATDAIGLGLNLPIRRIVFATVEKYDGVSSRLLTPPEIRQIAGRAGRYGIHEEGQVTALHPRDAGIVKRAIEFVDPGPEDGPIWISPTDDHLRRLGPIIETDRVSRLLQFFAQRVLRGDDTGLRIADLSAQIEIAIALEMSDGYGRLPFETRCVYTRAPISTRGPSIGVLTRWASKHARDGIVDGGELLAVGSTRDRLLLYEDQSRLATLYLWLAQRFPEVYRGALEISSIREQVDAEIQRALLERGARSRKNRNAKPIVRRMRDGRIPQQPKPPQKGPPKTRRNRPR